MRNPATLTALVLVQLTAGFGAGLRVGEGRSREERPPVSRQGGEGRAADPAASSSEPVPAGESTDAGAPNETARLRERVRILEIELQAFCDLAPATPPKKDRTALASQRFEDFLAMERGGLNDPEVLRSLFAGRTPLDLASAKIFIDRDRSFGAEAEKEAETVIAVRLALPGGGPDAG